MRKQLLFSCLILLLVSSGCKKNPVPKPDLQDNLQQILEKHLAAYKAKFPGKAVGMGLYIKEAGNSSHGQAGKDQYVSSGFPVEYGADIHFRGASTTKTFTAASILRLSQQKKLNLDDFITATIPGTNQPYIPATSEYAIPNKARITIRLLLQHRAGVFDITNDSIPATANAPYAGKKYVDYTMAQKGEDHTFTTPEMTDVIAKNQLSYFEPGTAFHYSNSGYRLLSLIIERVSGQRYDQFLQSEFLTPLQMKQTFFPYLGTDQLMPTPYVKGYIKIPQGLVEWDDDNVSFTLADGNIITTPAELATWCNALYAKNTILNADLHAQMIKGILTNEEHVNYGLGTELNPPDIGYGHNGARPAHMTVMRYHPETNSSYVLFTNFLNVNSPKDIDDQGKDLDNIVREAIQAIKMAK